MARYTRLATPAEQSSITDVCRCNEREKGDGPGHTSRQLRDAVLLQPIDRNRVESARVAAIHMARAIPHSAHANAKKRRGCASLCRLDHPNDGRPMSTAEYFKEQAERCRRLAQRAASPVVARELLELAADFLRRATELESSGSPVAQQQQQIQPKQDDE
jgi:hypothetical protein